MISCSLRPSTLDILLSPSDLRPGVQRLFYRFYLVEIPLPTAWRLPEIPRPISSSRLKFLRSVKPRLLLTFIRAKETNPGEALARKKKAILSYCLQFFSIGILPRSSRRSAVNGAQGHGIRDQIGVQTKGHLSIVLYHCTCKRARLLAAA